MENYSIAMKLHQEPDAVLVATLLTAVGAEVRERLRYVYGLGERHRSKQDSACVTKVCSALSAT